MLKMDGHASDHFYNPLSILTSSAAQVPNMIVMAPSDEAELIHMVATAAAMDRHPICFRFPRGNALGVDLAAHGIVGYKGQPLPVRATRHTRLSLISVGYNLQTHSSNSASLPGFTERAILHFTLK